MRNNSGKELREGENGRFSGKSEQEEERIGVSENQIFYMMCACVFLLDCVQIVRGKHRH